MATFTNFATLSYRGGTTESNTVVGELLEPLTMTKTAVMDDYTAKDDVTYVISLVNSGTTALTGLNGRLAAVLRRRRPPDHRADRHRRAAHGHHRRGRPRQRERPAHL